MLTHQGQLWGIHCGQKYWPEKSANRALAAVPMYHKNAMAGAFKPLLHVGGSVIILPDFEPRRFLRTLSEYRCTNAGAVRFLEATQQEVEVRDEEVRIGRILWVLNIGPQRNCWTFPFSEPGRSPERNTQ